MSRVCDPTTLLLEACEFGQSIYNRVTGAENAADSDEFHQSLTGSPMLPFWMNEADSILFYTLTKTCCLVGRATGHGFLISRLPTEHPTLLKWSAPCFVRLSLWSLGLSLGRQTTESFTACMSSGTRVLLYQHGVRSVSGLEAAVSCGASLQHKADLLSVPSGGSMRTVGINLASGALLDLSLSAGSMQVDAGKNAEVYGPDVPALQILHGPVEPPREMQPLYASLNAVLHSVERVTPPARVSASLERMTAGFDPDRRTVLSDGSVLRDEQPPPAKKDS